MPIKQVLEKQSYWIDRRLLEVYHNDFAYSAEAPKNLQEWKERRDFTRSQVRLAAGLDPEPEKIPLEPKIWGHAKHEGTVIAKVSFESMPGLVCTGNLYMPERIENQAPGILCPHGHWKDGRIAFNVPGVGGVVPRCLMLARLGFVVFSYDMVGRNDCNRILHELPDSILREAALSGAGIFGLQTWNSLRAVDFICGLDEVDQRRIGCTGTSGGASQTWTVSLLDERIRVMAPVCMLSSHFQGGCQCEEAPLLRINGITSFDILSACAPRPLMLPSVTQDWTVLNPRYEIPELRKVYALFNAQDALANFQLDAPHNYNRDTRERVYPWFTHWLLNQSLRETISEDKLAEPPRSMLLHTEEPEIPTEQSTRDCLKQICAHLCKSALPPAENVGDVPSYLLRRRELLGSMVNNDQNLADVAKRVSSSWEMAGAKVLGRRLSRRDVGDIIPAVQIVPDNMDREKTACLLLAEGGKNEYLTGGRYALILESLVEQGHFCLAPDLLGSGETQWMMEKSIRDEEDPKFFAFNPTLFSMRVQDVLTCLKAIQEDGFTRIVLVAGAGIVKPSMCAAAVSDMLEAAVFDMEEEKDDTEAWLAKFNFQPMIRKIGGLKGIASLVNAGTIGLYKADNNLVDYAASFAAKCVPPRTVSAGHETFLRLVEYIAARSNV